MQHDEQLRWLGRFDEAVAILKVVSADGRSEVRAVKIERLAQSGDAQVLNLCVAAHLHPRSLIIMQRAAPESAMLDVDACCDVPVYYQRSIPSITDCPDQTFMSALECRSAGRGLD